jgi:RHS repeat-associated protein
MILRTKFAIVLAITLAIPGAVAAQTNDIVRYYHTDAIGSVRMITDASQAVVSYYDYFPFGDEWPGSTFPETRKFAAKERDSETAFDYVGARYYASRTGRFTTVDPVLNIEAALTDPQRWNRYAYALNNPLRNVDPDGKEPVTVGLVLWGLYEVGSGIYDAYTAYRTWNDPNASAAERSVATGGLLAGILLPGGGYGTAGRAIVRRGADIVDATETGFHSFSAFKRAFGAAGENMEWHHVVEQTAGNVGRFGAEAIHNAQNVIRLPTEVHRKISAYYSSKQQFTKGLTVRDWLRTQSLEEQRRFGRELLEQYGIAQ